MFVKPKRAGMQKTFWALLFACCLLGAQAAQAQIRPAKTPIVGKSLRTLLELIPGSPTDLPPYLVTSRDTYLLVTAGASYTEIDLLANPDVPPPTLARALSSALAATPLRGQAVKWSADRYSAAQVSVHFSRFGAMHGSNTVSLGPLVSGLRQAGMIPHLLLRVPRHAQASAAQLLIPSMHYGTAHFRWYDAHHLGGQSRVTVAASLTAATLAVSVAYCLLIPIIGLSGLWLASFLSRRLQEKKQDTEAARRRFRAVSALASTGALTAQVGSLLYILRTPYPAAFADLWFGSSSVAVAVPFLLGGPLFYFGLSWLARRQETRRFGALPASPALSIPMSDEEKAARKRITQWSALPHIIGGVAVGSLLFLVPRTSPLYSFIHPIAIFLPIVGAGLIGKVLGKSLHKFTQTTLDDALTWRARQLGQTLGVRMPDVLIEDSSRAAHLVFASHQGHHVTLSRKLQQTFSPAEADFVLAHHLACMKRRAGISSLVIWGLLMPLPFLALMALISWPKLIPNVPSPPALLLSAWFIPALIGYIIFTVAMMIPFSKANAHQEANNLAKADRDALEVTGNLAAAESALEKMAADEVSMLTPTGKALASNPALTKEAGQAGRLLLRRLELQKTAQTLHFAPAPGIPASSLPLSDRPLSNWNPDIPAGEETSGIPK